MDFAAVLAQLNDLPSTFSRSGAPYTQIIDSLASQLSLYTNGTDKILLQLNFANALGGWLDTWGLILDLPRQISEPDSHYALRITETVLAWVGTVPAIQAWLNMFAPGGTIVENVGAVGYVVNLPATLTASQIQAFFFTLIRIRPAGVPFTVNQIAGGLYLNTVNFLGEGRMTGAYLYGPSLSAQLSLSATTNNAVAQLPDLYFIDPTLNPGLA